jgi:hypothetical protein
MPILAVPNETELSSLMLATEGTPGVFQTPTKRMALDFTAVPGVGAVKRSQDATGGYDRTANIRREFADPSGTIGGAATYQELAILSKYAVKGGVTGTDDGNTVHGYTYNFVPAFNADDMNTFSALYGVDGLPWQATGVRLDEFNISGDATSADNQWQIGGTPFLKEAKRYEGFQGISTGLTTTTLTMTGAGWTVNAHQGAYVFLDYGTGTGLVRQIASNTATALTFETAIPTPGSTTIPFYISGLYPSLAMPTYDIIEMEGTQIFLDVYNSSASTLGTTNISDRVLSFNVTQTLNLANKRRASGIVSRKGRGAREVSGTLRFEFDRWDEYAKWIGNSELSIRIQKTGPIINPSPQTNHRARIDVERAVFDAWTEDADNNNMTVSLTFLALQETPIWNVNVITNLAVLP